MEKYTIKLKEARKKRSLNQSELAEMVGTDQRVISQYENGTAKPSLDRLIELAEILEVSLDELIEIRRIQKGNSDDLNNI